MPTDKQLKYYKSLQEHRNRNTGRTWFKKGMKKSSKAYKFLVGHKINIGKKNHLGFKHAEETKKRISIKKKKNNLKYWLGKKRPDISKENNYNWKGGTTKRDMTSPEYKKWRLSVFTRDNFTCLNCEKVGGSLEAHHIDRWKDFPNLRFDINNGVTLCKDCHNLTK